MRSNTRKNTIPKASVTMPAATRAFLLFHSDLVRGLILPSALYLFSTDCPVANPIATPIAGPIPMNPKLSVTVLRGIPIPENMAMPIAIQIPTKWHSGYFSDSLLTVDIFLIILLIYLCQGKWITCKICFNGRGVPLFPDYFEECTECKVNLLPEVNDAKLTIAHMSNIFIYYCANEQYGDT